MTGARPEEARVVVIGAGASGLAVANALRGAGVAVRILDGAERVAEPWRRRHPQLRLNTHRRLSSLPGLELPRSAGAFPARDAVVGYLERYAGRLDVPIEFGVHVQHLERDADAGLWRIDTAEGCRWAEHVVIATGRDRVPFIPHWPGMARTRAEVLHSADLGDVRRFRGRRILVVGAGNSGMDALNHLVSIETKRIWVSVRHGPAVFPTRLFGFPVQLLSPLLDRLPVKTADWMLALTERIAFGDLRQWGLPRHADGGASRLLGEGTAPAIDNGFIRALTKGRADIVAPLEAFRADHVRLTDGRMIDPDVVICATGYRPGLEPMLGHLGVLDERGFPTIDGAEQDSRYPGLWFSGMRPALSGFFRAAGRNAAAIAAAVRASMPERDTVGDPSAGGLERPPHGAGLKGRIG